MIRGLVQFYIVGLGILWIFSLIGFSNLLKDNKLISLVTCLIFALFIVSGSVLFKTLQHFTLSKTFDKPAFRSLNFLNIINDSGNILKHINGMLMGKFKHYHFRIKVVKSFENYFLEIVPMLQNSMAPEIEAIFVKKFGYCYFSHLGKEVEASSTDLNNYAFLSNILSEMEDQLYAYNATPIARESILK
ncbi:hypothetical protein [Litoribacter populi]|uniref:hypothetical protein n=1 Tax=Litoribacter populi TaxID=2598460 RepID=UPI00118107AB|nr:hypothetical protein [Litoribacter populi]